MTGGSENNPLYQLTANNNRKYCITVSRKDIWFEGDFWYLKEKEFVKCSTKKEVALPQNFLGMGYLTKRSYKKTLFLVFAGTVLEAIKLIIDKLTEWIDKANDYLQWIDSSINLPEWMNIAMNIIAVICILTGVALFFSKKKMIEISFIDKRLCVPKKSMTKQEYNALYQSIAGIKQSGFGR
ncbi:MAG: hypothetical protein NC094_07495 [Bacteroidales bacterium]|nr:hypothetical protein [Lachnoclostridium sp.]MCM1384742.1 hypothetical protein [Lachnoclostridium sp.]MCM1465244.1 hypothetical protein [Bacteroidales bacterium]